MISFEPLWQTLKDRDISQYKLIKEHKISTGQLDRLRKNGNVNTYTLNQLCKILKCDLADIAIFIDDNEEQTTSQNILVRLFFFCVIIKFKISQMGEFPNEE